MVTEVQPLGSALLQGGIAFLFYVIPFGIGKRAFGARLGGTTLPPDPGSLRFVTAPIPSRAASEHFWDRGEGAKAPSWPWAEAGSSGRFRLGARGIRPRGVPPAPLLQHYFPGVTNTVAIPYFKRKNGIQLRLRCRQPLAQYFLHLLLR